MIQVESGHGKVFIKTRQFKCPHFIIFMYIVLREGPFPQPDSQSVYLPMFSSCSKDQLSHKNLMKELCSGTIYIGPVLASFVQSPLTR
jgi:hypothetical protein